MTDPDPNPFADCDFIVGYGGAKLFDKQAAATIVVWMMKLSAGWRPVSNAGASADLGCRA
jgi:hypothetical protein